MEMTDVNSWARDTGGAHHCDTLTLLSYHAGECSSAVAETVRSHCAACGPCAARLRDLDREKEGFLSQHPFTGMARQKAPRVFTLRTVYRMAAVLVVSICAGFLYQLNVRDPGFRTKGAATLSIAVKTSAGAVEQRKNNVYAPGEYIQFVYSCAEKNKFILFSVDDEGDVTVYYPQTGDSSIILEKGSNIPLANSILLDEYIGKELFVGLFSEHRVSVAQVLADVAAQLKAGTPIDRLVVQNAQGTEVRTMLIAKQKEAIQ